MSDGVVTFVTDTWLWVVPRCELRAAQLVHEGTVTRFIIELERGQRMGATAARMPSGRGSISYAEWKWVNGDHRNVIQAMIRDLRADVPVDVRWERDMNSVWTRTENAR